MPSLSVSPIPTALQKAPSDTVLVSFLPRDMSWGDPLLRSKASLGSLHPLSPCCFRPVAAEYITARAPCWLGSKERYREGWGSIPPSRACLRNLTSVHKASPPEMPRHVPTAAEAWHHSFHISDCTPQQTLNPAGTTMSRCSQEGCGVALLLPSGPFLGQNPCPGNLSSRATDLEKSKSSGVWFQTTLHHEL